MDSITPPRAASVADARLGLLDPRVAGHRRSLHSWLTVQKALHLDPVRAVALLERVRDPHLPTEELRGEVRGGLSRAGFEAAREVLAKGPTFALPYLSDAFPLGLRALPDAAPLLLVRGHPGVLLGRAVAIVGARAATAYGLAVAAELATALAQAGIVVVSGLARGVDAAAHRAALDAGGLTVAFLACGPDVMYPPEHADLARDICERGAVVTEMPPGTPPLARYFPLRNRLIAALAELVVVVEGRLKSGSLVTARRAADHGVDVLAVPGPIHAPTSEGPNRLLRDGARPVLGARDLLDALALTPEPVRVRPPRHDSEDEILASLRHAPASRDDLARRLGKPPQDLSLRLMELELEGVIRLDRDGRLRVITNG